MEKQKRWQFLLILAVITLTIYNIVPTLFYYSNPLSKPISEQQAQEISLDIAKRINDLEEDTTEWLAFFCKNLNLSVQSIELLPSDKRFVKIHFHEGKDAELFKKFLPRAGELIPFVPSQLRLSSRESDNPEKIVFVERRIELHLDPSETEQFFTFSPKKNAIGDPSEFYRKIVYDRAIQLAMNFTNETEESQELDFIFQSSLKQESSEELYALADKIIEYHDLFGKGHPITQRFYNGFSRGLSSDIRKPAQELGDLLEKASNKILSAQTQEKNADVSFEKNVLKQQADKMDLARKILREYTTVFNEPLPLLSSDDLSQLLQKGETSSLSSPFQKLSLENYHPFIKELIIDWENDKILFALYSDVETLRKNEIEVEKDAYIQERLNQLIVNTLANASRFADEVIKPEQNHFVTHLANLSNSQSILAFDLGNIANKCSKKILYKLLNSWKPLHKDFSREAYPVINLDTYQTLSQQSRRLALVVYNPSTQQEAFSLPSLRKNAIYVIAHGLHDIMQKYEAHPDSEEAEIFIQDFNKLREILQEEGFIAYPGSILGSSSPFNKDFIFELNDYYGNLLKASREDFTVHGTKRYATLEFTDVEQRILTTNRIEKEIHESLLKWRDEFKAAQVDLDPSKKYLVPPPSRNIFWSNLKLSTKKYLRGDDSKILKWGLDLSGGKMVRIGLRDQNQNPITNDVDLKQGLEELTSRVNKMGLSEVNLRIEGNNIVLDFPGSQNFSASDLIKSSSMYFHVVNEKFSPRSPTFGKAVHDFLQDIWNEAVVTNRKDPASINEIAWNHLGGANERGQMRSSHAKLLYDNGLRIPSPKQSFKSTAFNDTLSSIALFRGDGPSEWRNQSHPLFITFHNYALEGSNLENVHASYDPEKGNILSFSVKSSYSKQEEAFSSPRESLYAWTQQFSQEKIIGTPKEEFSRGEGWRMAVILNGTSISEPTLNQPLRHQAMIYGKFSQREVNKLVADLKAGSLSFTPQILSEQNISPDLGKEERFKGIFSAFIGLFFVITTMIVYYRFAGFIASCAVILNLLIMWGVLQNLDAALTLAGIAGIILTVGMAVDANVLVFERVREEFAATGRIASAIHTGYRKAYSAIIDSNITTIIAALILIQFDSGPIKGFAITLIVGIAASMFSALFLTRFYFSGWLQNPKNKQLNMLNLIGTPRFDFLGKARLAVIVSLIFVLLGSYSAIVQKQTLLGMDFTGGYALTINLDEDLEGSYRARTRQALLEKGASDGDFQIRELNQETHLLIHLGTSMEEKGRPFYQMPLEENQNGSYEYQKNPRISWIVQALSDGGLHLDQERLVNLDKGWTSISGQLSNVMRNNALIGLGIALLSILIYITIRFEFKYAISAIIGVAHDVIISLGLLALLHSLGLSIQMNMETIAAVMTIIGYSLNDTIIIFDRIREDVQVMRKKSFAEVISHALNATLSRTLLTSGTTLLVLLSLVFFGGDLIFDFAFTMAIGIVVGTLSSLFVAAPTLNYFHNLDIQNKEGA